MLQVVSFPESHSQTLSVLQVPRWKEGSSSRSALGPSEQAQPSTAEERSSRSRSTSEAGGSNKGSGEGSRDGVSGQSSSSSSSGNISTPASSVSHTSSSDISSSSRSSDTASSVGRTLSSETLSGSGTGSGSGGSKAPSSDSGVSQQRHSSSGDSSRGEAEEGGEEGPRSQRQETGSLEPERSFSEGSQPSLLQKPMDPSPGHEGGVSSSGSSSGSGSSGSASLDASFVKSQSSQSIPALPPLPEEEEVVVIEESVPETVVSELGDVQLTRSEVERDRDVASATKGTRIGSQRPTDQSMVSDTPAPPESPELLQETTSEQPEDTDMQASPEFLAPPTLDPRPPQPIGSTTPETPTAAVGVQQQHSLGAPEPMELDQAHAEVSSQSSFALQLSQSQVFSTPLSGILSPAQMPRDVGASIGQLDASCSGMEEVEDHEREYPNLMEISHASASDESIGSQKQRSSQSDTSMSSSSQSGRGSRSSGPDSTPPDGGGGASGEGGAGGGGEGGADGGGRAGGGGEGGADGGGGTSGGGEGGKGSERAGGRQSEVMELGKEETTEGTDDVFRDVTASKSNSQTGPRADADKQQEKSVPKPPSPDVTPPVAPLKPRPVPVYESIRCDSSPEESEHSASRDRPLQNPLSSGSDAVVTPCQTTATAGSQLRSTESQHSELTPSGTCIRTHISYHTCSWYMYDVHVHVHVAASIAYMYVS